jgi:hypothetical protein
MRKTGEAYTAARAQIMKPTLVLSTNAGVEDKPTQPDYAALAGMADEKVKAKTGCTWERWVYALDRRKAWELSHRELARLIREKYKTPDWWTQTVAVGYERIKGKRALGQRVDGRYHATKSKTFHVPVETLFAAWTDTKRRRKWLSDKNVRVRKATAPRSIRLEQDGSIIAVWFEKRGPAKCVVSIEEGKLPSKEAADAVKAYWAERLNELGQQLNGS